MSAMQVEQGGQRVWISLLEQTWTPQDVPRLMEHMTRAQRREVGYNQNNQNEFATQFANVLRRFEGDAVGEVVSEVLEVDGWWRLPNGYWVLSQLQDRARVAQAMRTQWESVEASGDEARVLGRWMLSAGELKPADIPKVRALRGAGNNPETMQISLDILGTMGWMQAQDLEAGRACALSHILDAQVCYHIAAIVQRVGCAGGFRDEDFGVLFHNAMGPRFGALVGALKYMKERALPALELLIETWHGAFQMEPPELATNVMDALISIEGGPQTIACLEALSTRLDLVAAHIYFVAPWIQRLDKPGQRERLWLLLERMWNGLNGAILKVPIARVALAMQHPKAVQWVVEGLGTAATPNDETDMHPWLNMVQSAAIDDSQRNAIARFLLRDLPSARGWRRAGAQALLAAKHLEADVRALLMARWSEVYAQSLDSQGRRLPRAPKKKRLTLEVLTFAVAIHEQLQDPIRAEIAGRALARWSHIHNQVNLHNAQSKGEFFDTLDTLITALFCHFYDTRPALTPAAFEALSRGLLANVKTLTALETSQDKNNTATADAREAALDAVLFALLALYTPQLSALRASHPPLDRLCHLVEDGDDPSASASLTIELTRFNLPPILVRCLTPSKPLTP